MNASFHKACCFLQVYSHTIALAGAQGGCLKQVMPPSAWAARAGCSGYVL